MATPPGFSSDFHWRMPGIRFPFVRELRKYSKAKFKADMLAGATLALVSIPQAVAFALILGLPLFPVVLSVIIGGLIGALFFSSRHHVFGPTSSISLVVASALAATTQKESALTPLQWVVFMTFIIGVMQFAAGMLRFGEVAKFISRSVVTAYSAAIGLILAVGQLHHLLGTPTTGGAAAGFVQTLMDAGSAVASGKWSAGDMAAGMGTFLIFAGVQRWLPRWPVALVALGGMGILSAIMSWHLGETGTLPFKIVMNEGALMAGFGSTAWFAPSEAYFAHLPSLFGSALAIAIIGMLESAAVTRSLAMRSGQSIDANQELMGMGAGNVVCAFCGAAPGSSSFSRSEVIFQSGAATQLASIFSSIVVLGVVVFVMPAFGYIPVASLAALLIRVGWKMLAWRQIRIACRSTHSDATVFACTLAAALLLRLDVAIYVGIVVSLALFLQKTSSPILVEYAFDDSGSLAQLRDKSERTNPQIAIIHVEGELFFGAADVFLTHVQRQAEDENIRVFILRLKNARHLDASTVMALESLREYLVRAGRHLLISGCSPDVLKVIRNSGTLKSLGAENIFEGDPTNPNVSTRKALIRAMQVLSSKNADIRIFYDKRRARNPSDDGTPPDYTPNFQI